MRPGEDVFRFRRFAVRHGGAALRLGTDAVMLGAWCGVRPDMRRVLDAGAGCGVLALMAAQRTGAACGGDSGPCGAECGGLAGPECESFAEPGCVGFAGPAVDAVELDPASAALAAENFAASPWARRMRVWQGPLQGFPGGCREIAFAREEKFKYIAGAYADSIPGTAEGMPGLQDCPAVGGMPEAARFPERETPRAGMRARGVGPESEARIPGKETPQEAPAGLRNTEVTTRARKRPAENESDAPGEGRYDLVVSNPPWFEGATRSPKQRRAAARHGITMTYADLAAAAFGLLGVAGRLSVVVPFTERCRMLEAAWACGFALEREAEVAAAPGKPAARSLMEFAKGPTGETVRERFCLTDGNGVPAARWLELTGAFYPPRRENGK